MSDEKEEKKNIGVKENPGPEKTATTETVEKGGAEVIVKKGKITTVTVGPDDAALLFQASGHVRVIQNLGVEDYIPDSVNAAFAVFKAIQDNSEEYNKLCDIYSKWATEAQVKSDKKKERFGKE